METTTRTVTSTSVTSKDGTTISFEKSVTGPAIILVDAALADRSGSTALAKLLAPKFTVVNYDRRGRGKSSDTRPYAEQREIEDIEALIDAVAEPAYLFGYSSGAVLALDAANKLGSKVRGVFMFEPPLIIDDSWPTLPADYVEHLNELISEGRRDDAVNYFMDVAMHVPADMLAGMKQSPMWPGLVAVAHTLPYDGTFSVDLLQGKPLPAKRWANAKVPTMVMVGTKSPPFFHTGAKALVALLADAEYTTLEGRDHSAVMMAPNEIAAAIIEFFAP